MPKVTFNETRTVNDGTGLTFTAGQTYDLPTASCERWIKRGVANYAEGSGPEREPRQSKSAKRRGRAGFTGDHAPAGADNGDAGAAGGSTDGPAEIPADWADLQWHDLLALAKGFDAEVRTKEDAIAAIELEIERRKAE